MTKKDRFLDAKHLNCPLPILKTKTVLHTMEPGQILYVETTDPHSVVDFTAYCAKTNHQLLDIAEEENDAEENIFKIYIKRAKKPNKI